MMRRLMLLAALPMLIATRGPNAATQTSLLALQAIDLRVATLAQRLATSGGDLCRNQTGWTGIVVHDLAEYERDGASARVAFGLGNGVAISVVVADSAAAKAGFRSHDEIMSINGKPVSTADTVRDQLDGLAPMTLAIVRGMQALYLTVEPDRGCASRVIAIPSRKLDAGADGKTVRIRTGVVGEAADDDELAFVIAHEMAHNILGHPALLDRIGRRASTIRPTEVAADQLGVRLLKRAGYDPHAAARFWAHFGKKVDAGIFSDGTHQGTKDRVRTLEAAANAVTQ
jgi:beta-barrel assembly-enhancing protease